jgi:hypothetical protein
MSTIETSRPRSSVRIGTRRPRRSRTVAAVVSAVIALAVITAVTVAVLLAASSSSSSSSTTTDAPAGEELTDTQKACQLARVVGC